jgi:RES domain-containing protein
MLACLAHAGMGRVPRARVAVEIAIVLNVSFEHGDETNLPIGWDQADLRVARAFGDTWIRERRTAVLHVPPVVARRKNNLVINPQHLDFKDIIAQTPEPVVWDARLFDPPRRRPSR